MSKIVQKKWISVLLFLTLTTGANEQPLSLAFEEMPVEQVLQALADYQQLNLMVAPGVEGNISVRLRDVPWEQALSLIARLSDLLIEKEGNVLLVYPDSWKKHRKQREKEKQEALAEQAPLENFTLILDYVDAETVNKRLLAGRENLMSARGSVTVDTRKNALLLRDTSLALKEITRWVRALDIPLEQVELTAHIVSINEENLHELGVSWGIPSNEVIKRSLRDPTFTVDLAASQPTATAGLVLAKLDGRLLELELSALESENQIEIIASPRLFTSHQKLASIKQGTEIPYEVSNGTNGRTSIEFKEAVLGMEVTPAVHSNGRISLKLRISQNVPGRSIRHGDGEVLAINKQEIETQIILKNGQTLALGGIFQQEKNHGLDGVPFLSKLPWLGALFRHEVKSSKRRELVIFITPRLVSDV